MNQLGERQHTDSEADEPLYQKQAGAEPIPGCRLLEPLGAGGFGEVWKCEVPGGLVKALKFVYGNLNGMEGDRDSAEQELEALQHIKAIRHPFLLSIERIEVIDGELMIVMELADRNLAEVLAECRAAGMPGVPREELLALLLEGAEALDLMNFRHGLQHLDVKPRNLFLVSNHLKVADFGLVNSLRPADGAPGRRGGITPLYASPETLQGGISRHSDQYSLAVVYQELLTGAFPFSGKNGRQVLLQCLTAEPNLAALPEGDRLVVARALSRDPERRFASCLDFLQALAGAPDLVPAESPSPQARTPRPIRLSGVLWKNLAGQGSKAGDDTVPPGRQPAGGWVSSRPASSDTLAEIHLPPAAAGDRAVGKDGSPATPRPATRGGQGQADPCLPPVVPCKGCPVLEVGPLASVVVPAAHSPLSAVASLVTGGNAGAFGGVPGVSSPLPLRDSLVTQLLAAGTAKERKCANFRYLHHSGDVLEYKCLVRLAPEAARAQLDGFGRQWKAQLVREGEDTFRFRIKEAGSLLQRCVGRQAGFEVHAELRPLQRAEAQLSVATVRIRPLGGGEAAAQRLWERGPVLFENLRSFLQPDPESRNQERFPYPHSLRVFPVRGERQVGEGLEGKGKDVSRGGVGFLAPGPLPAGPVYLQFHHCPATAAFALLARVVRSRPAADGWFEVGACFPADRPL